MKIVKIKTWDQMVGEFGVNKGDINCQCRFISEMEDRLPKNRIIEIYNWQWVDNQRNNWDISNDMIEYELTPDKYPQYFI